MAAVTVRGCALCTVALLNFAFVFISGADFIRFISFSAIYHNITGETTLCQGKALCGFVAPLLLAGEQDEFKLTLAMGLTVKTVIAKMG